MLRYLIFTLLVVSGLSFTANNVSQSENTQPYIYYYSNIDHAIVVERADGTDSRLLGQGLMPLDQNVIGQFEWSASGEWVAWTSKIPSEGGANLTKNIWIMYSDGTHRVTVLDNPGGYFQLLKWSPKQDYLLVVMTKKSTLSYLIVDPAADKIIAQTNHEGRPVQYLEFYNGSWLDHGDMIYFFITVGDTQLLSSLSVENQTTTRIFQAFTGSVITNDRGRIVRRNDNFGTNQTDLIIEDLNDGKTMTLIKNVSDKSFFSLLWAPKFDRAILTENQCPQNTTCQTAYPNRLSLVNWAEDKVTFIGNDLYLQNIGESWSPDSNFIVLRNATQQTVIFNIISFQVRPIPGASALYSWRWLGTDNMALYAIGDYQSVGYFLFNAQTNVTQQFSLPVISASAFSPINSNFPISMIPSPNGRYLGTRENNGMTYKIYDREQDKTLPWITHSFAERGGLSTDYLWQSDNYWYMTGQRISFAGGGGGPEAVMILNVDGTVRRELGVCFSFPICAGFVPDRVLPYLVKGNATSIIQQPIITLSFPHGVAFAWSPDSTQLATFNYPSTNNGYPTLQLWDLTQKPPRMIKEIPAEFVWSNQENAVGQYIVWNTDGKSVSIFNLTTFKTWNIETGLLIDSGEIPTELSPNRQYRWKKTDDIVTILDAKTNHELNRFQFQDPISYTPFWSLDGSALYSNSKNDTVTVWESSTNKIVKLPVSPSYVVNYLAANKHFVVAGNQYTIAHVWDMSTQKQLKDLNVYPITARFSPNGKYLAAATSYQITIWETADFK